MPQVKTDLLVEYKTKGLQEAQAQTQQLGQKGKAATKAAQEEAVRLEQQYRKLVQQQTALNRAISQTEKGTEDYKKLAAGLKEVEGASQRVARNIDALKRAHKGMNEEAQKAQQRKGAFYQGLIQGGLPEAQYLQRGPGMMRQAAGVAVGRSMRGVAGGLAATPFSGIQGIGQALQSIPGGGLVALPMMQAAQQAQQAMQFRQVQQQAQPFLGGFQLSGRMQRARQRVPTELDVTARAMDIAREMAQEANTENLPIENIRRQRIEDYRARRFREASSAQGRTAQTNIIAARLRDEAGGQEAFEAQLEAEARQLHQVKVLPEAERRARREAQKDRNRAQAAAVQRVRRQALGDIVGQGQRFGYAAPEATQMVSQISQVGGGVGREIAAQRMLPISFAAQRMGIGPEVAGAFLQGGRRGGVVGGQGRAGMAFEEAIRDGMRIGLEGSELTEWMSQMATDIRNWRTTGIPINTGSISGIARNLAGLGLGGVRGGVLARGFASRAQDLSRRGPQSAAELMMYEELGGFKAGGGAAGFEEAQLRLQKQDYSKQDLNRFMTRVFRAGGGGAEGRAVFRRTLGELGMGINIEESRLLEKQLIGGGLSPAEQKQLKKVQAERERGMGAAQAFTPGAVAGAIDPALKRQASIQNMQIRTGDTMLRTMQAFEKTTSNLANAFTKLGAEPLKDFSTALEGFTNELPKATERAKAFMSGEIFKIMSSGEG